MPVQLVGNRLKVFEYLKKRSPEWVTYEEIEKAVDVHPSQQVFLIINLLKSNGLILAECGHFRENEWAFSVPSSSRPGTSPQRRSAISDRLEVAKDTLADDTSPAGFGRLAESVMSKHYGLPLHKGVPMGIPQVFSMVSDHGEITGDALYSPQMPEESQPPSRFSEIAEKIWLLEKTSARQKFLVFGNYREVPVEWLNRYGHLVKNVAFYFLTWDGELETLKAAED